MSRVGINPISVPQGVEIAVKTGEVAVKGPKGALEVPFNASQLEVQLRDSVVQVQRKSEEKKTRALHGLIRTLIANAVTGVTEGFSKRLDIFGVGYRAEVQGKKLTLYLGHSHPIVYETPEGIELSTEDAVAGSGAQIRVVVRGIDKQQVGQVAADIRDKRKPDPYKGKGVRYEDEVIHWKAGKAATVA